MTFETVRRLAMALPDVEEGTIYGTTAYKVGGKMFACRAIHSSAEPGSLAVRVPFDQRDDLLTEQPDLYYITDHYVNYPVVLVRLSRVNRDALQGLLRLGHQFIGAQNTRRGRQSKRRAARFSR